jgi:nucleoside-diphosphate-sugar epimerase
MRTLFITGGNGYIGRRLTEMASSQGRRVVIIGRKDVSQSKVSWRLGEPFPLPREQADGGALIHLAHDWSNRADLTDEAGGLNKLGTHLLQETARQAGVTRFVFVSSQSARADAPNIYGRLKWQTEKVLTGDGIVSARLGLVYGGPRRAMYGLLCKLVARLPVVPMISPNRMVQPIHIDDVCHGLIALADNDVSGWRGLAQSK